MRKLTVRIDFFEEVLGMSASDPDVHEKYIASKAADALSTQEEVEALGVEEVIKDQMTVFPRDKEGNPIFWDYQIKGFFKDTAGMLRKVPGTKCSGIKSYKKEIDGLLFPQPRMIKICIPEWGEMGSCQRPLRASTMQGERIALANSETIPVGSYIEFSIECLTDNMAELCIECLDYGKYRGMGQWRNSGKGRFTWHLLEEDGVNISEAVVEEAPKKRGRKPKVAVTE